MGQRNHDKVGRRAGAPTADAFDTNNLAQTTFHCIARDSGLSVARHDDPDPRDVRRPRPNTEFENSSAKPKSGGADPRKILSARESSRAREPESFRLRRTSTEA